MDDFGHPSQDRTFRHAGDALLRRHGFRIHSRPKGDRPLWQRDGVVMAEETALALVRRALVEAGAADDDARGKLRGGVGR